MMKIFKSSRRLHLSNESEKKRGETKRKRDHTLKLLKHENKIAPDQRLELLKEEYFEVIGVETLISITLRHCQVNLSLNEHGSKNQIIIKEMENLPHLFEKDQK